MLGIDLGRLRQRLGLLQRRLEGLERGSPASISNTVPHATESSWISDGVQNDSALVTREADRRIQVGCVLAAMKNVLSGRRPDFDSLEIVANSLVDDVDRRGAFVMAVAPTDDSATNRASAALELGRLTAFLLRNDERLAASNVPIIVAAVLCDSPLLESIGLDEAVARERRVGHGEIAARLLERSAYFSKNVLNSIAQHHARLDGSDRPQKKKSEFGPEARLLTVAAAYLEHRWPRPDENPVDPRRALRETLLEAESGKLDLAVAFRLLDVSFFPPATLVELSGGEWAEVLATQKIGTDLGLASLPIVRLVRDAKGSRIDECLVWNLAQRPGCRVVRTLSRSEIARAA
jgi:hypothetical protein